MVSFSELYHNSKELSKRFANKLVEPIQFPADWDRVLDVDVESKLRFFEQEKLYVQKAHLMFEARCLLAKEIGFQEVKLDDLAEIIMGEPHNKVVLDKNKHLFTWVYNHYTDQMIKEPWATTPRNYYKIKTMGLPFGISRWHVRHDTLRHLKQKIAPSTIRVMEGVLNLKLFNVFSAIGPVDCFDSYDSESSPIILGSIWLMPYGNGKPNSSGSSRGFVLGV